MVKLVEISGRELYPLIRIAYQEDYELFAQFHIKVFDTLEDAIGSTLWMIAEMSKEKELKYYMVAIDGHPIGYMVTFDNFLYSFGINIQRRIPAILTDWMEQVRLLFNSDIYAALYNNNKRAIQFLKKFGFCIVGENKEHNFVTLVNEYSCQS